MYTAANRLLVVSELLELVLLELDGRSILCRAQRVCQTWRRLIASSPRIQAELRFKPWSFSELSWPRRASQAASEQGIAPEVVGLSCPDLIEPPSGPGPLPYTPILSAKALVDRHKGLGAAEASWRRMLVPSTTPIKSIGLVTVRRRANNTVVTRSGRAMCPDGLRLGHVWDALRDGLPFLQTDLCLMRLAWWASHRGPPFDGSTFYYPAAADVARLFDEGAQVVLTVGFTEVRENDGFCGRLVGEYQALRQCEDFAPLRFDMREVVARSGTLVDPLGPVLSPPLPPLPPALPLPSTDPSFDDLAPPPSRAALPRARHAVPLALAGARRPDGLGAAMYATGHGGDALAGFALRAAVWLLTWQCGRGGPRGGDELREGLGNEQARYYEEEQETVAAQAAPAK
ncbi:hypothetical protein PCL_07150 [Purpureocillium lilacinum]|uniref:F-box domain-containing protein n=1 Tax=Purpureocillium lilacinum TaxID=33203 RepID=A0A2U3DSZ3_PURLI|nr:hypothetical protein PCL_07150 [Purpureocillium lilacinum]